MEQKSITEEMQVHKEWYEHAKNQTLETLPDFLNDIMNNYNHDYGTICHALASGAIATAWAMNSHEQAGITGFQAGAVMWEFIRNWNYTHNKTGLKIVDYDNFLFPQYESRYEKVLSVSVWEAMKSEAAKKIEEAEKKHEEYLVNSAQYEKDIIAYVEKHPDYFEREEYYNRLGIGTGEQWEQERIKKESGFEFAPHKPYEFVNKGGAVYKHWQSIVNGQIPFGYTLEED